MILNADVDCPALPRYRRKLNSDWIQGHSPRSLLCLGFSYQPGQSVARFQVRADRGELRTLDYTTGEVQRFRMYQTASFRSPQIGELRKEQIEAKGNVDAHCPDGKPCEAEAEDGHPCDRDEQGQYLCRRTKG
jgi:hypothetical protein